MTISPSDFNLFDNYLALGEFDKAHAIIYREDIADNIEVIHRKGVLEQAKGKHQFAILYYEQALKAHETFENCIYNLSNCYYELGDKDKALYYLRRLITINPAHSQAVLNAGEVCFEQKKYKEAADYFDRYLWIFPHMEKEMLAKLVHCLQWAEHDIPDDISVKLSLYKKLEKLGLSQQAHELRVRGLHANPQVWHYSSPDDSFALGALIAAKIKICKWDGLAENISDLRYLINTTDKFAEPVFNLIGTTQEEQFKNATRYTDWRYPDRARYVRDSLAARRGGKTTIGYLSSDFYEHATSYLIAALFEHHDRSRFNIVIYSCGINDHSPTLERLRSAADSFVDLRGLTPSQASSRIKADEVDILVDLKGYTSGNCADILALRPAPIIVAYLGYPSTTGGLCDYILADKRVIPEHNKAYFSEQVVYIEGCYQINDDKCVIAPEMTRAECGLPEKGNIYGSFNQPYKITPPVWQIWMDRLRLDEGSYLWQYVQNDESLINLQYEASERGIDPARIIPARHLARPEHLSRMRHCLAFFDTLPVSGHTTMSDALRMGLTIVTPPSYGYDTFISNVAHSLIQNQETLFDAEEKTRQIEAAFLEIVRIHNQ